MQINQEKNKITFVFEKNGLDFEFGKALVNQLSLPNMIDSRITEKNGKYCIEVLLNKLVSLQEALPNMSILQNTKCIYELFYAVFELNCIALLDKSALWCDIENIYYDTHANEIKYVILPITKEISYKDELTFEERLKETISFMAGYLPFEYKKTVIEETDRYIAGILTIEELLTVIKELIHTNDSTQVLKYPKRQNRELSLVYFKEDETIEYIMKATEIVIGKGDSNVDLDFSFSEAVSRLHCKIIKQNQLFFVQDMDSVNHTLVNGETVPAFELMELEDMDLITVGDTEVRIHIS